MADNAFDIDAAYGALRPHQRALFDLIGAGAVGVKKIGDSAVNAFDTMSRILGNGAPVTMDEVKQGAGDAAGVAMAGSMPFARPGGAALASGAPVRLPGVERALRAGQAVDEPMRMLTTHNLTGDNLAYAARKYDNNIPVPSIGISRLGHPLEGFGEVSLVASPNLAKPSRSNPVYSADAYTRRFPDIVMDVPSAGARKKIVADLAKAGEVGPGAEYAFFDALKRGERELLEDPTLIRRYMQERGIEPPPPNPDSFRYNMALHDAVRRDEAFKPWVADYIESLPMLRERIRKGYSDTTGNALYAPHTIDNIVKALRGKADTEGFNYGLSNLRAAITPQFGTLADIQAARGRLQPKETWKPQSDAMQDEIHALAAELPAKYRDSNRFIDAERKFEAVADAIRRPSNASRELEYQFDASRLPPDLPEKLLDLRRRIQDLPTDYFEAKPQRAVGINEFEAALVPDKTPDSVLDILHRNGIKRIEGYDGTPAGRAAGLRQFNDLAFSRGLPITYGYQPPAPGEVY